MHTHELRCRQGFFERLHAHESEHRLAVVACVDAYIVFETFDIDYFVEGNTQQPVFAFNGEKTLLYTTDAADETHEV